VIIDLETIGYFLFMEEQEREAGFRSIEEEEDEDQEEE